MKIAGFDIQRTQPQNAARARRPLPSEEEIGNTGTAMAGGFVTAQDYNAELAAPMCYDVYDKMRKGDGQVKAALTVIKLPLVNAEWKIKPGGDTPLDKVIAEVVEEDLLGGGMESTFSTWFRQMLLHLDYGVMPFEKCWRIGDDGLVRLKDLAPRMPRTVQHWLVDDKGKLTGVRQVAPPTNTPVDIPKDKLLLFINDLEGSDFRGVSLLRSAYKHWYMKDKLYLIQGIAVELRATGINVGTLQQDAIDSGQKDALEKALMTLSAHQRNYFVEVEGQTKLRVETGQSGGRLLDPQSAIEHHDLRILRSMIVEFVGMGAGSTGSLAMHRDKTSYVLLALGAIADTICDTVNRDLIRQWVDYNWPGVTSYPSLRYTRLEQRDIKVFAEAIEKLERAKVLTIDDSVEEEARDMLSLPERVGPRPEREESAEGERDEGLDGMTTKELIAARRAVNKVLQARRKEEAVA